MADISKIKLPDNSVVNIKDARITGVDTTPTSGSANVVESGGIKEAIMESAGEVIIGTQTAATGNWTGVSKLATASDMKSGYRFTYWLPYAGSGNATLTLTFQDGTTKAINCYIRGASRLTTHIPAGSKVDFCYLEDASVAGTTYTGAWIDPGYWDGNSYDRILSSYELRFIYSTETPLYRYKICGYNNGKIVPLVITNQTSGTIVNKTPTNIGIDPEMGLVFYNSTTNITNTSTAVGNLYNETPLSAASYTFNYILPIYRDVYLKGVIGNDGLFYLYNPGTGSSLKTWYTCAPNRQSDDDYLTFFDSGFFYMFVGTTNSNNNGYLQLKYNNPVFFFNGERLVPLEEKKAADKYVVGNGITEIVSILRSDYDALTIKNPSTLYIVRPSAGLAMTGNGTDNDPIVGWYESVATVVNPDGIANGTLSVLIPGIYSFWSNTTPAAYELVYFSNDGETDLLMNFGVDAYGTYTLSCQSSHPKIVNTDTYQAGSIEIHTDDSVVFKLRED